MGDRDDLRLRPSLNVDPSAQHVLDTFCREALAECNVGRIDRMDGVHDCS